MALKGISVIEFAGLAPGILINNQRALYSDSSMIFIFIKDLFVVKF